MTPGTGCPRGRSSRTEAAWSSYKLAHNGYDTWALQEWLGHSNIQNTARYAELTARRLEDASQQEN